ncbi:hypothetical protein UW622_05715, partial [Streptococcus agalactiae]
MIKWNEKETKLVDTSFSIMLYLKTLFAVGQVVAGFVAGSIASSGLAFGKVPFAEGGKATLALAGVPSGFLGA